MRDSSNGMVNEEQLCWKKDESEGLQWSYKEEREAVTKTIAYEPSYTCQTTLRDPHQDHVVLVGGGGGVRRISCMRPS
jgi:hypothetical protein